MPGDRVRRHVRADRHSLSRRVRFGMRAEARTFGADQDPVTWLGGDEPVPALMNQPMMPIAEADQVAEAGRSTVRPVANVVDLRGRVGAGGSPAQPLVPVLHRSAQPAANASSTATQVQRCAIRSVDGSRGRAVACQPASGDRTDPPRPAEAALQMRAGAIVVGLVGSSQLLDAAVQHQLEAVR